MMVLSARLFAAHVFQKFNFDLLSRSYCSKASDYFYAHIRAIVLFFYCCVEYEKLYLIPAKADEVSSIGIHFLLFIMCFIGHNLRNVQQSIALKRDNFPDNITHGVKSITI